MIVPNGVQGITTETSLTTMECQRQPECTGKIVRDIAYPGKTVYRCTLNPHHNQYLIFEGPDAGLHDQ